MRACVRVCVCVPVVCLVWFFVTVDETLTARVYIYMLCGRAVGGGDLTIDCSLKSREHRCLLLFENSTELFQSTCESPVNLAAFLTLRCRLRRVSAKVKRVSTRSTAT